MSAANVSLVMTFGYAASGTASGKGSDTATAGKDPTLDHLEQEEMSLI